MDKFIPHVVPDMRDCPCLGKGVSAAHWQGKPLTSCADRSFPYRSFERKVGMAMDLYRLLPLLIDPNSPDGQRLFRATIGTLASFIVLLLASSSAGAATLNVSGGQLLGASGVIVDGSSYDVEFLDGTCIALYGGCDELTDFTFQTAAAAALASQALLDQVFLDGANLFDTDPELTNGCTSGRQCRAFTPYETSQNVKTISAQNFAGQDFAGGSFNFQFTDDLSQTANGVYAVWSIVPEPGPAVLMGLGLLGLAVRNRRHG